VRVALYKDAFESFLFAVALAVGLTPEKSRHPGIAVILSGLDADGAEA